MTGTRHLIETEEIFVDVGDEIGAVYLEVELSPTDLVGTLPEDPGDRFLKIEDRLLALVEYGKDLRALLEAVKCRPRIYRELDPSDARAIAASLVHYASEIERRR